MTVIAYRGGVMACDSLCADETTGEIWFQANKIFRTRSGALVGCSGAADARAVVELLQDVRTAQHIPSAAEFAATKVISENGILIALPNGEAWGVVIAKDDDGEWSADACELADPDGFAATGCGAGYALTAMKLGLDAHAAVAVACDMNAFCRPPIYSMKLHP